MEFWTSTYLIIEIFSDGGLGLGGLRDKIMGLWTNVSVKRSLFGKPQSRFISIWDQD